MKKRKILRERRRRIKVLSAVVALVLVAAMGVGVFMNSGTQVQAAGAQADSSTASDWESCFSDDSTSDVGRVWTDKSVSTGDVTLTDTIKANGQSGDSVTVSKSEGADFLVSLSALSSASSMTTTTGTPLDIVLVLDQSGSMAWDFDGSTHHSWEDDEDQRQYAMKQAVGNFIDAIYDSSMSDGAGGVVHNLGIVTFGSNSGTLSGFGSIESGYQSYKSAVDGLPSSPSGATNTGAGMTAANNMLPAAQEGRQSIVVLFTDGVPTRSSEFSDSVANTAISQAYSMKNTKDAIVYSIGIFDGADTSYVGSINAKWSNLSENQKANRFMNLVSSNSLTANSLGTGWMGSGWSSYTGIATNFDCDTSLGYYKTASDSTGLNSIFEDIFREVSSGSGSPTQVTEGQENQSGYITFTDTLGSYMEVTDFNAIVFGDVRYTQNSRQDNGDGTVTYTFTSEDNVHNALYDNGSLSDILITVTKGSTLAAGDTVEVKIPATLIPVIYYDIENGDNGQVGTVTEASPIRIFYSVSVKDGVQTALQEGETNSDYAALQTYMEANKTEDGTAAYFYSNAYTAGAQDGSTTAQFTPASGNSYYFFAGGTALYTRGNNGNYRPVTSQINKNTTYYYQQTVYTIGPGGRVTASTEYVEVSGAYLQSLGKSVYCGDDRAYYIAATAQKELGDAVRKTENETATADNASHSVWSGGNITTALGNNGRIPVDMPGNLVISKTVTADEGFTLPDGYGDQEFKFTLTLKLPEGIDADAKYTAQITDADGERVGNVFTIGDDGTFNLKDGESLHVYGLPAGATYEVTETAVTGYESSQTNIPPEEDFDGKTIYANKTTETQVTNTYTADAVTLSGKDTFGVTKVFNGRDTTENDTFTFTINADQSNPDSNAVPEQMQTTVTMPAGTTPVTSSMASFGDITYTKPGTYVYYIEETAGSIPGVSYSGVSYRVTVTVTPANGELQTSVSYAKADGEGGWDDYTYTAQDGGMQFTNTYSATATDIALTGKKELTGRALNAGEFSFQIISVAEDDTAYDSVGAVPEDFPLPVLNGTSQTVGSTVANGASGDVSDITFGSITFTAENIGHTYTYVIGEVIPGEGDGLGGVTYTKDTQTVVVTVTEDTATGQAVVAVTVTDADKDGQTPYFTFKNSYTPASITLEGNTALGVRKTLTGRSWLKDETYTFTIENTAKPDGVVTAPMPEETEITVYQPDGGNVNTAAFGSMTFTQAGVYKYEITENAQTVGGVTMDTHSAVVTVTVTDNLQGQLVAGVTYDNSSSTASEDDKDTTDIAAFTNKYSAGETTLKGADDLAVTKTFTGRAGNEWLASDSFTFVLAAGDDTTRQAVADGTVVLPGTTELTIGSGSETTEEEDVKTASFGNITFSQAGDYVFTVTEQASGIPGVTDDSQPVRTIYVQVTDNLDGTLTATVGQSPDGSDSDDLAFTNTYSAGSVTNTPTGIQKVLEGRDPGLQAGEFTFEMKVEVQDGSSVDGFTMPGDGSNPAITTNDADGNVTFGDITFTQAGTYKVTVRETVPETAAPFMEYSDNVYSYTVTVTDDPSTGNLKAEISEEKGEKTLTNTYDPGENTKTVGTVDDPETDIDGQMVAVGSELTYTINWVNDALGENGQSVAANVTVTDTLPTGTEFVSAEGGSYADGVVTWSLGEQAAGATGQVQVTVRVTEDAAVQIENQATVTVGGHQSNTNTTVNTVPKKSVEDSDDSTEGTQVGDTLTYTISYANSTDEPVEMVITDPLSEGLTYVADSASEDGVYDADSHQITWELTVEAHTTGAVTFQAVVNEKAVGATVSNQATIQVGDNPGIKTNTTETKVSSGSLAISKTIVLTEGQGTQIDKEKDFTFTVSLTDKNDNALTGAYAFSGTSDGTTAYEGTVENGGTITLRHGGSVTITGLPEGAKYTVTEAEAPGYTPDAVQKTGAIAADATAQAAFTNTYSAGSATLSGATNLQVTKEFSGKDWTNETFTFTLTQTGGDTSAVTLPDNAEGLVISAGTEGNTAAAAFGDIRFTAAGDYEFTIEEKIPQEPGQITYDTHKAVIKVTVTDNQDGTMSAVASATTEGSMTFKNIYTPQAVTANIKAQKAMSGRELRDTDTFTFAIAPQNGAPATTVSEVQNNGAEVNFGNATFTEAGTYEYVITETGGAVPGVTNSAQTVTATVTVTYDASAGTLTSSVTYRGGDGESENTFTNVYKADPVVPAGFETGITGTKTVTPSEGNSYTMQGGEFSFTLTPDQRNPKSDPVTGGTVHNDAQGNLVFANGSVTYTESGIYKYTIRENNTTAGGITIDSAVYEIVVNVTDDGNGKLAATVSISKNGNETDAIVFDNSYNPAQTSAVISGTKVLTGKDIEDGMFTFQITGEGDVPMPASAQVTNTGNTFSFGSITYTQPGTYVYHVSEVNAGQEGYTYDGTVYDVTVSVTDVSGVLQSEVTVAGADGIAFTNSYTPEPVTLTGDTALRAHKTLTGRDMNSGEFTFEVKDADGNVLAEGNNDGDGNIIFGDLTFNEEGTWYYTISEKNNSIGGITYDGSIYTVRIVVTDAGGHLEAAVTYYDGEEQINLPAFENEYTASSTAVSLGASKTLTGRALQAGEFTFVMKDADGNVVAEAANDANGSVKFEEVTFDQPGTYTYTVSEVKGDDSTITYDETVYTAVITVTDDLSGHLAAKVTDGDGNALSMTFDNKYTEPAKEAPADSGPTSTGVRTGDTAAVLPLVIAMAAALVVILVLGAVILRRRRR